MASTIDATKPESGNALTSDVRANFLAAKNEIEALQAVTDTTTLWAWIQSQFSFAAGLLTFFTTPTSANLAAALTDETGTGAAVFANNPAFTGSVLSSSASGGIGYSAGAGGGVTQLTSKSTGVTLNNICGIITMDAAALAAGASVTFTLTNSVIAATDLIIVNTDTFPVVNYSVRAGNVVAGSCDITVTNESAGSLSNALHIRFAIIKAVVA